MSTATEEPGRMTCIHQAGGLCESCRADYQEDPSSWVEFGDHVGGLARWRKLQEEMYEDIAKAMSVPAALLGDEKADEIPF